MSGNVVKIKKHYQREHQIHSTSKNGDNSIWKPGLLAFSRATPLNKAIIPDITRPPAEAPSPINGKWAARSTRDSPRSCRR
ncbi:hypothetical protein BDZ97DRAFT_1791172 [Flammula alnicola]|nr:hypothetical protein BDZ97DRAFT_1791172 [Flammula alnicola]